MPFVSRKQQKACYAKRSRGQAKGWNCEEWSEHTNFKSLPEKASSFGQLLGQLAAKAACSTPKMRPKPKGKPRKK